MPQQSGAGGIDLRSPSAILSRLAETKQPVSAEISSHRSARTHTFDLSGDLMSRAVNCLSWCPFRERKAPQVDDLEGASGAGGIRTHTPSRAPVFETGAIPIMRRLQGIALVFLRSRAHLKIPIAAPGFELRSPPAILARLGGHLPDRFRGSHSPASAEPPVLASA